jgi:FkbM family methyltransferase
VLNFIIAIYRFLFARPLFYKMNKTIYRLSLSGLGILNYENDKLSGELSFLTNSLTKKREGVVVDIGANVGNYTTSVRKINPNLSIYAYEPHPITFKKLKENRLDLVNYFNYAVGVSAGVLELYDYKSNDGSSHASLYKDVIEYVHKKESLSHSVNVVTLDSIIKENNIEKVVLLKIDTEGNELNVLRGGENSLKEGKIDAIHFEFNEMNISSKTYFRDIWDLLPDFAFFRMLPNGLVPIKNYSPLFCEIFAYQNIVAIRKSD